MKTSLCGHNYTNFAHSIGLLLLETYFPGKTSQQCIDVLCHWPGTRKAWAYIFAFPSTTETFGQVVLEAMASALPVVGVLSEGVCDLVQDGRTGFLLDAAGLDEHEQARGYRIRLEHLVYNAPMRFTMGQNALNEARQRCWPAAMQNLFDGYQEVIMDARPLAAA